MVLNDPCDHRYVLYTHGGGPGSLWEASGLPPKLPGVIAGGVRLVSLSVLYCSRLASTSCITSIQFKDLNHVRQNRFILELPLMELAYYAPKSQQNFNTEN